ncbi:methyl-CpG-binding domain protein 5 [Esox lucius]|uniref:MBD domain-containing protein n=1 Tax=Esox lucius TaxID=8010 RepID=A0A3P8ZHA4_ESOLU|nr:methyl-CpG-binding domain protein 5 [Esox lucius]XP_010878245.2 methyl-CpG-binding domain protein 5 [Esox lucius]XP_019910578.2 methyl-CpG-binding domain protein 5 [Esox lucius]
MNRTKKYEGLCGEGKPPPTEVPIGWQRRITHSGVVYISPSGSVLACLEQVKSYLLTDGTCKCGLECPLIIQKIFNFDSGVVVKQRTAEDARADADVTKLCIHKRKIIAVATLHRSMESPHPPLALSSQGGGLGTVPMGPLSNQALRNNMHDGPPKSVALDGKNLYKMGMLVSGQRYYNHELGSPPQRDLYYSRTRLGASDHSRQQRSPYCSRSVLLSPSSSTSCGAQHYGDGTPSPRTEPLGSPEPNMLGFHGACSPGSAHMNGDHFTPLSPPSILLHGSPSTTQPSCTLAVRSNIPSSPIVNEKSPIMQNPTCNFPRSDFPHKPQPACHPQSHLSLSQLPPCVLQKKQVTSEKDPLGILDPIPSMGQSQVPLLQKSGLQHNAQSQVPPMNVNIPPASVPLPSNLPLPTGKSGPVGHGQRVQHHQTPSSVSSSPIMSPVHIAGPSLARVESPHRSRCSSGSSEHGSFAHPTGLQVPCGSSKPFPRSPRASLGSPRASLGSPRPAMPPSSAFKMDKLHHLNDPPNHLSGGLNSILNRHPNSMCPPAPGSDGVLQRNHSVGMPLNQILDQQNPASFPASSLLSAAAKAQLVNQNKHPDSTVGVGTEARSGSSLGHPGLVGGGRGGNVEGHSTLNQRYIPNPGPLASEGQSGRAALRDKLMGMAQQREANRKRKLSNDSNAGGINNDRAFDVLKHPLGGSGPGTSSSNFPEPLRRMLQQGGLPQNTSMAQLLQSMSHQNACNGPNHIGNPGKSAFLDEGLPQLSTLQQNVHGLQIQSRAEVPGFQNMNIEGHNSNMEQFIGPVNQIQDSDLAGNFGVLGYGGQHATMGSMHGNPNPHQQQFGHYQKPSQGQGNPHFRGRPGLPPMISNGSVQTLSESDEVNSSLSCELRQAQEESLQSLIRNSQTLQQQRQQQRVQGQPQGTSQGLGRLAIQGQQQHRFHPDAPLPDGASSNPMNSLLESFQVSLPERTPLPNRTIISQPGMMSMSHPGAPCHQEGHGEYQAAQGLQNIVGEILNPIHKPAMGPAIKGRFNVITSTGGNTTLGASVVGEPVDLSHAINPVIHGPLRSYQEPVPELRHHPKVGRPRKKTPERNNGFSPVAMEVPARFRSPRRGAQRRQWDGEAEGQEQAGLWHNDELLQQLSLAQSRNITYPERRKGQVQLGPLDQTPLQFPSNLYAHTNGSSGGFNSGGLHPRHLNLAPGSSSSGPPEGHLTKDYGHLNGHLNGHLKGHLNGHHYNGHYNGHLNGSLSSEEDLRPGDVPFSEGPQLHHRPRTQAHYPGELLWGQGKGFLSWPGKMGNQGHLYSPGMLNGMQGKVESEKFQRTLTEDLETLQKANKITRNGGKRNNHLEAAIQEAMSELDKMTGSMSQRERQVKTPKPKRRKISR